MSMYVFRHGHVRRCIKLQLSTPRAMRTMLIGADLFRFSLSLSRSSMRLNCLLLPWTVCLRPRHSDEEDNDLDDGSVFADSLNLIDNIWLFSPSDRFSCVPLMTLKLEFIIITTNRHYLTVRRSLRRDAKVLVLSLFLFESRCIRRKKTTRRIHRLVRQDMQMKLPVWDALD